MRSGAPDATQGIARKLEGPPQPLFCPQCTVHRESGPDAFTANRRDRSREGYIPEKARCEDVRQDEHNDRLQSPSIDGSAPEIQKAPGDLAMRGRGLRS